tara:strand:+ start:146 stop:1372 length:1227 start_codon:yes stop_codon:yes gene_type:complete
MTKFTNPFRPGAGHMPPYLAGRKKEEIQFLKLLKQDQIIENLVLTGLRGVGKTVLLETFKPLAIANGWLWAGTDMTEVASISEVNLATRLITDLSVVTSGVQVPTGVKPGLGFGAEPSQLTRSIDFEFLKTIFDQTPGLVDDKLKAVLEFVWKIIEGSDRKGIIFAYDEAQNLSDNSAKDEFPLSILLDVFQSIQRKGIPFMLALTGLPTLFPKLVEARTYAERMFRVVALDKLDNQACREAITVPVRNSDCPIRFTEESVDRIVRVSGGYPYFIQFICREVYDVWVQAANDDERGPIPVREITRKLDTDFFAGRWARATDRQRDLMWVVCELENSDDEFTVQEIVEESKVRLEKPFTSSHANQILGALINHGLVYKNRHGKYMFAVPLMADFVRRQSSLGGTSTESR